MQKNFAVVEVEFPPSIGHFGADSVDLETLFMNVLVVSDTHIYYGVGNCLVAKNGGRHRVFMARMEYHGETSWNRRHLEPQT